MIRTLIAAAALAVMVPGCATPIVQRPPLAQTQADERALVAVEVAYRTALEGILAAVGAGLIEPGSPDALRIAQAVERAHRALAAARAAHAAGNSKALAELLAEARRYIGEINP